MWRTPSIGGFSERQGSDRVIQSWKMSLFERNNRKLDHYLRNVENAIVLLSANDREAVWQLQRKLVDGYGFETVDFAAETVTFVGLMSRYQDRERKKKVCIYRMGERQGDYDLVKTMNLCRDLLRGIGIVVLLMPAYMVEQIRSSYPNLYDYITVCLDYNLIYENCMRPIYSEENRFFVPRKIRTARKSVVMGKRPSRIGSVADFSNYMEMFEYRRLKRDDAAGIKEWLCDYVPRNLNLITENYGEEAVCVLKNDLYIKTAYLFVRNGFYQDAEELFAQMVIESCGGESRRFRMEVLQGRAYSMYLQGDYEKAAAILDRLEDQIYQMENQAWAYRVGNDRAVCLHYTGRSGEALALLKKCEMGLRACGAYSVERRLRILYNRIYMKMDGGELSVRDKQDWRELGNDMHEQYEEDSLAYLYEQMLSAWIAMLEGRLDTAMDYAAGADKMGSRILQENDERKLWICYIAALIRMQRGEQMESRYYQQRFQELLKNRDDLREKYKHFIG